MTDTPFKSVPKFPDKDKTSPYPDFWDLPLSQSVQCPQCGMEFKGAVGYVCYKDGCPIFLRATC